MLQKIILAQVIMKKNSIWFLNFIFYFLHFNLFNYESIYISSNIDVVNYSNFRVNIMF